MPSTTTTTMLTTGVRPRGSSAPLLASQSSSPSSHSSASQDGAAPALPAPSWAARASPPEALGSPHSAASTARGDSSRTRIRSGSNNSRTRAATSLAVRRLAGNTHRPRVAASRRPRTRRRRGRSARLPVPRPHKGSRDTRRLPDPRRKHTLTANNSKTTSSAASGRNSFVAPESWTFCLPCNLPYS
ncbi:hypothetical protein DFH08DRAFT_873965 [Mycena albidolilacea]|uniref:Uncharacterized protein n=1 Tax=Mycena albidolilacea TaxID=1033008 RepID=A0AAD7ENM1_9AGAR|nr:hypothetical protein DFH08DRAFT_873965 [Mycena albidolilacea]